MINAPPATILFGSTWAEVSHADGKDNLVVWLDGLTRLLASKSHLASEGQLQVRCLGHHRLEVVVAHLEIALLLVIQKIWSRLSMLLMRAILDF